MFFLGEVMPGIPRQQRCQIAVAKRAVLLFCVLFAAAIWHIFCRRILLIPYTIVEAGSGEW